jgi:hypothetical protein
LVHRLYPIARWPEQGNLPDLLIDFCYMDVGEDDDQQDNDEDKQQQDDIPVILFQ